MQRLQQVRLSRAVRPDDEYETAFELEIEPRVRPDVAQRDRVDDQISQAGGSA
jgi:hypothetical protein